MTNEDFVRDWMAGMSVLDIAAKHGVTVQAVTQRAHWLRTRGVNLPRRKDRNKVDVAALNAIVTGGGK